MVYNHKAMLVLGLVIEYAGEAGSPVRKQIISGKVGADGDVDFSDVEQASFVRKHVRADSSKLITSVLRKTHEGDRVQIEANGNMELSIDDDHGSTGRASSIVRVLELQSELSDHKSRISELEAALEDAKSACKEIAPKKLAHESLEAKVSETERDTSESVRWTATQKHVDLFYGGDFDLLEADIYHNRVTQARVGLMDGGLKLEAELSVRKEDADIAKVPQSLPTVVMLPEYITIRNHQETKQNKWWLQMARVEVFRRGVIPDNDGDVSSNSIANVQVSGWSPANANRYASTNCKEATCLVGSASLFAPKDNEFFALNWWVTPKSITLKLPQRTPIGVVRVWQRHVFQERLRNFEVIAHVAANPDSGATQMALYSGQPTLFGDAVFGPHWEAQPWSSECPTECGLGQKVRTRIVICKDGNPGDGLCHEEYKPSASEMCAGTPCCGANANMKYVGPKGSNEASGCSEAEALATVSACTSALPASGMGHICYLMAGTYHESTVVAQGIQDLTIKPAPSAALGSVIVDGTTLIEGDWEPMANGAYRSVQPQKAWQIWINGQPMTPARWPNALMWTEDSWDFRKSWATQLDGTFCGHSVDGGTEAPRKQKLSDINVSMNGCNLIMNNEHWITKRYVVENHTANTGIFDYFTETNAQQMGYHGETLCQKYGGDIRTSKYYIDGCVAALDIPGEWAYDGDHIVIIPPVGVDLSTAEVRGKVQTYAFVFDDCPGLEVSGLSFFGTALLAHSSSLAKIFDNTFMYPSASRRALGAHANETDPGVEFNIPELVAKVGRYNGNQDINIPPLAIVGANSKNQGGGSRATFSNNYIFRSEGAGVLCQLCFGDTFSNNEVVEAGYPFATGISFFGFFGGQKVTRNSVSYTGAQGIGRLWGEHIVAELNRVTRTGMLIVDVQGIGGGTPSRYTQMKYNWAHDNKGLGLRYDAGEDGRFPDYNDLMFNVVWRNGQGGITSKSDHSKIFRNVAIANDGSINPEQTAAGPFGKSRDFIISACYPYNCVASAGDNVGAPARTNNGSITLGNIGGMDPFAAGLGPSDLPGTYYPTKNVNLLEEPEEKPPLTELFRDWSNQDFRPKAGGALVDAAMQIDGDADTMTYTGQSPDIGPYEFDDLLYWIPGRQYAHASAPVPPNGATDVKPDADLMFLQAARAVRHEAFMGADPSSLASLGQKDANVSNIFTPANPLVPGTTYYWRVDAVSAGGSVVEGDVWTFAVGCADSDCVDCGRATAEGSCLECKPPLVAQGGFCAPDGGCLRGKWSLKVSGRPWWTPKTFETVGGYKDSFSVENKESLFCSKFKQWQSDAPAGVAVLSQTDASGAKTAVGTLACNTQNWKFEASKFYCMKCAKGFSIVDSHENPSGCTIR